MTGSKDLGEGLVDARGRFVPSALIKDIDLARHEFVLELVERVMVLHAAMTEFKRAAMGDIEAFLDLSADRYGATLGGTKGNVTLLSFDGKYKVQRQVSDFITFDERLQAAKALVDECINEWASGSRDELRALVSHAFQTDRAGKVSTERILGLRRLDIADPRWSQAMRAITDSIHVVASKSYLRFYERDEEGRYVPISLDLASIGGPQ